MYATVLRLGLWILILVLALYVMAATFPDEPFAELIPAPMLQQALVLAIVLIIAGFVLRIFGAGARVVAARNRCRVCRTEIPHGAIYCREHLRTILHDEDEKTHHTRVRR
jgi:predicted nucleic acid-binding Zn ribbon protein